MSKSMRTCTEATEQEAIRWCLTNLFADPDAPLNRHARSSLRQRLRPDLEGVNGIHFDLFISSIFRELSDLLNERLVISPPERGWTAPDSESR